MRPMHAVVIGILFTAALVTVAGRAVGTPLYAARAGRTCDNCHLTPNTWKNPELADRRCSLACQACHVDPAGGGMRNASGRFYGRATLPAIATSPRPTADWDREVMKVFYRKDKATTYSSDLPLGPDTYEESLDPKYAPHDFWARGRPAGTPARQSFFRGRYGAINADPMLRVGWDVRMALLLSRSAVAFPMQVDLGMAFHPVEHLTLLANTGARGRTNGIGDVVDDPRTPYLREGYVLLHELPYLAYAKAGRFVPSYGLRLDDHTSFIRRRFELDGSLPETRVTGVEIGAAPNYPFVNLSWFKTKARDTAPAAFDPFDVDEGWGSAVNLGYRSEGWSAGASAMFRRRPLTEGGDADTYGIYVAVNPWFYSRGIPLTYQAEVDRGTRARLSGLEATGLALYQELDWSVGNGLNLLLSHEWEDPDREVKDDAAHRVGLGWQLTPVPGVTLDTRLRGLLPAGGEGGVDGFVQLHLWN